MAGCTGAGTSTFRNDAIDIVVDRPLHHGIAVFHFNFVSFTVKRDVYNFGHFLFLCKFLDKR
jgi:hypothetical protein